MKYVLCAICVLACSAAALADRWAFPEKLVRTEHVFGETKIVLEVDGTKSHLYPPHTLSIYAGDELLARYKNVGFEKVFASSDNRFFVGLSNDGIPGTAFVVFDAAGNLLREVKHPFLPAGMYTQQSITRLRQWYDDKDPGVEFDTSNGVLHAVLVRGSNRQKYSLLERDLKPREVPAAR